MGKSFKILAIDGGAVWGSLPAFLLSSVKIKGIDLFAGSSVGCILSTCYAMNKDTKYVFDYFNERVYKIFQYKNCMLLPKPEFKDDELNKSLKELFNVKFSEVQNKVIIPSFNMVDFSPKVYDNFTNSSDNNEMVWEIVRKSVAAPSIFNPQDGFVDSGVFCNNPSQIAINAAISKLGVKLEDIELFSIGCGITDISYSPEEIKHYYRWNWISPLISLAVKANQATTEFSMRQLPLKKYIRFNPVRLKKNWKFTDTDNIDEALEECCNYKTEFVSKLENFMNS